MKPKGADNKACGLLGPEELKEAVRQAYSRAAEEPQARHPFPVGRAFAEEVGYPPPVLDSLPAACVASFAGIYPVAVRAELSGGQSVLDIGCGAGLDALIAAQRVAPGQVVGVDFSAAMVARAKAAGREAGRAVEFQVAEAGGLSLLPASFDVVLANGVLNLNPERQRLLAEMAQLLRPGGKLWVAEIVAEAEQAAAACTLQDWFR